LAKKLVEGLDYFVDNVIDGVLDPIRCLVSPNTVFGEDSNVIITDKAFYKMFFFTEIVETEIGGILLIKKRGKKLVIEDAILIEQDVSVGTVNLSMDAMSKFMLENPDLCPKIKGWWHSHANGTAFFSSVDETTSRGLADMCGESIAIVTSKGGITGEGFNMLVGVNDGKNTTLLPEVKSEIKYYNYCMKEISEKLKIEKPWFENEPLTKEELKKKKEIDGGEFEQPCKF